MEIFKKVQASKILEVKQATIQRPMTILGKL